MLKKILIGLGIVLVVFVVGAFIFYLVMIKPAMKEIKTIQTMEISSIDMNTISDGNYLGDFTYGKFTYQVDVTIKDHKIETIKVLKNRDTKYAKMAEGVIERIKTSQSPNVDAITGATTTSKALMKAVENALTKGVQK